MACEIHNFTELAKCLEGAVEGEQPSQHITFASNLFAEAGELAAAFGSGVLVVRQRDAGAPLLTQGSDEVLIAGVGTPFPTARYAYEIKVSASYEGTASGGHPTLQLTAKPLQPAEAAEGWTFAGNFASVFPEYLGSEPPFVAWRPSFFSGARFEKPVFRASAPKASLHFSGEAVLDEGSLRGLQAYFGRRRLAVGGAVELREPIYPLVELTGTISRWSLPGLGTVSLRMATVDGEKQGGESVIELVSSPEEPTEYAAFKVSAPLLQGDQLWLFEAKPDEPAHYTLEAGLDSLSELAGLRLTLPEGLGGLGSFGLSSFRLGILPGAQGGPIGQVGATFETPPEGGPVWEAPILGLKVSRLAVRWDAVMAGDERALQGEASGRLESGGVKLDAAVQLSGLGQAGHANVGFGLFLDPSTDLTIDELVNLFTGFKPGLGLKVVDMRLRGDTGSRALQFVAELQPKWRLPVGSVDDVLLRFDYAPNAISMLAAVEVTLLKLKWMLSAAYLGPGQWEFSGLLLPEEQGVSLEKMLEPIIKDGWLPKTLPAGLGKIELRALEASFSTPGKEASFDGVLAWPFDLPDLGLGQLELEAELSLQHAEGKPPQGRARGLLKVHDFAVGAVYQFGVKGQETLAFEVDFRGNALTCVFSKNAKGEKVLRAHLTGVSFGDLVAYLAGIATGDESFSLPSPWSVLYDITFDRLWLETNLTTGAIGASYELDFQGGFVTISKIELTYQKRAGSPSIELGIVGEFGGVTYGEDEPLGWDLLNESPPPLPGKGEALLDLRYLALGQSVARREERRVGKVSEAVKALEEAFTPVAAGKNPVTALPGIKFSGDGRWLIGANFTLMETISVVGVFSDPSLYGVWIGLEGPRAKALAGLEFEVLYQRISDTIGLYHIELTLPQAMRHMQFGAVAVTLPTLTLDLYTNGNFRVDLGFPYGGDYSRSFAINAGVFSGQGGFYFGVLNGQTSDQVPAVSKGTFSPVIEFGVGLSVGTERSFSAGIVSGGASIALEAVVQGVLAWFNPPDRSLPSAEFYDIRGSASLVGKAWGSVDLVIIKASFTITASATLTLEIESYQPIRVELRLEVEVSARVKILFFYVTLSFQTTLDLSFTIGGSSTPPWQLAATDPQRRPLQLQQQRGRHRIRAPRPLEVQLRERAREGYEPEFDWTPRPRAGGEPVAIDLALTPSLTPALAGDGSRAATQIVMGLFVETSTPAEAQHAEEVVRVDAAAERSPFDQLAEGVLQWTLASLRPHPTDAEEADVLTAADLHALATYLGDRRKRDALFTYETVTELIESHFVFHVWSSVDPDGALFDPRTKRPRDAAEPPRQVAIFPMIPELKMKAGDEAPWVLFREHAVADAAYREALESYYDQLQPASPVRPEGEGAAAGEALQALSVTLFCDYFAMLAQQGVQQAVKLLEAYPYEPTGQESLADLEKRFGGYLLEHEVGEGETPATIAGAHGARLSELRRANPALRAHGAGERLRAGDTVKLEVGPTVEKIAAANREYPLRPGAHLTVSGVRHQVQAKETLGRIASTFGLADVADLVQGDHAAAENARSRTLLRPGAKLALPSIPYTVTSGDLLGKEQTLERIAATFYTRARQYQPSAEQRTHIEWFAAYLGRPGAPFTGVIEVPLVKLGPEGKLEPSGTTTTYKVRPTDTIEGVAEAFALLELDPGDEGFRKYLHRIGVKPPIKAGQTIELPPLALPLREGDSLESLAGRFFLGPAAASGLGELVRANGGTDVLAPRAVLALPLLDYPVAKGDSLGSVAERLDLTIEELAASVAGDVGILKPYKTGGRPMTLPHLAGRERESLLEDLLRFGSYNQLATMLTRFLLNGMRAPVPPPLGGSDGDGELLGLYEVAGQQIPAPRGPSGSIEIDFAKGTTASWVSLLGGPGQEQEQEAGPRGCLDELLVNLPASFFAEHGPSPTLDPITLTGPMPMRLHESVVREFPLEQSMPWQPAAAVTLPGPTGPPAGGPSLWPFPAALRDVARGASGPPSPPPAYELRMRETPPPGATAAPPKPLERYCWGTALPVEITRAHDDHGSPIAGTYELGGADQEGRELLLDAWTHLKAVGPTAGRLYLMHRASAATENSAGLVSDGVDPQKTFLLRTNLSTETHSNSAALTAGAGRFYARVASPAAFLREMWEASVTGSGGFHLSYATEDGSALPAQLFAADGSASLWLLLLLDEQSAGAHPDRRLHPFSNCAVVGDNVAAAGGRIYATPVKPGPADRSVVASVPPGIVGFGLAREHPQGATAAGPTGMTRQLHSLLGYRVEEGEDFTGSHEGLPLGPQDNPPEWLHLPPCGPSAHRYWSYAHGIPVAQFGKVNDTPSSLALPEAAASPYRGVTGPSPGCERELSRAVVEFEFHDVFGNTTACDAPLPPLELPVGYTDEVIAPASWPGAAIDYRFAPGPSGGVALETELALHAERYVPGGGVSYAEAHKVATGDAARYEQVFYQLGQADLRVSLASSIGTPQPSPGDLKAGCAAFVTKAKLFTDTAATLRQRTYETTAGKNLGSLAGELGLTAAALLTANAEADAAALFPDGYTKPSLRAAAPMNTLTEPEGTPSPRAEENLEVPLTPGLVLRTETRRSAPLVFDEERPNRLSAVAAGLGTSVYAELADPDPDRPPQECGLVADNWSVKGLIADGVKLRVGEIEHTTEGDSFETLLAAFTPAKPDGPTPFGRGDLAAALADVEGLLVPRQTVAYSALVVPGPPRPEGAAAARPTFSLASIPPEAGGPEKIAKLNCRVPNFFYAGSPLLLGLSKEHAEGKETIESLARKAGVAVEQLAAYNKDTLIGAGVELAVSDLVYLREPGSCWAAYSPKDADTLADAATVLGVTAEEAAELNRELLGVLRPGARVKIDGKVLPVDAASTIGSLFAAAERPGFTWPEFVSQLASSENAGVLREGGAVIGRLPTVPVEGNSIAAVATRLNVTPLALVEANRSLQGFLFVGGTVTGPDGTPEEVGEFDSVDTVLRRLAAKDPEFTLERFVEANGAALLTAQARVLLPPTASEDATPFEPLPHPPGKGEEAILFPVTVTMTLAREPGLVHPDFASSPAVAAATSALAPRLGEAGEGGLALDEFAADFEQAFATQRWKCAVASGAKESGGVWAVNFGAEGVSRLAVEAASPAFYALPPLSRTLLDEELKIRVYKSGEGLKGTRTMRFSGVDLDVWMRQLLETVDLFLTPAFSVPAFRSGATGPAPEGYEGTVAAKEEIAAGLRDRVAPIVAVPGATGPGLEAAGEALHQQMLVRLSEAYDVNAIVHLPADVASPLPLPPPGATGPHPPRISGTVVPKLQRVPAAPRNTLAAAAAEYGVSVPYLAQVLIDVRGLLLVGATFPRGKKIGPDDTLRTLAPPGVSPEGPWEKWREFVESIASLPILVGGADLPLSSAARVVGTGEDVTAIAEFFGRDKTSVEHANEGKPVEPGVELRMVEALPDLSLSSAKVSLGRGEGEGAPPLSFLVRVAHAERQGKLLLNLDYVLNELEYGIADVSGTGGYQASSWLTFVRPFEAGGSGADGAVSTAIPQIQVPIPLRAYPRTPILSAQEGSASDPQADTFPAVREWDYSYDFTLDSAAQDTDHLKVVFGQAGALRSGAPDPLWVALASFATAYPALKDDLARLPSLEPGARDQRAELAVQALSELATAVGHALQAGAGAELREDGRGETFAFEMSTLGDDEQRLKTLQLRPEPPGPTSAVSWPTMYAQGPSGTDLTKMKGATGLYEFPEPIAAGDPVTYRAEWPQRDVIFNSAARGSVAVHRNDRLIARGPLGPTGSPAPVPTCEPFVYRTPYVEFVDPLVPLVENASTIELQAPSKRLLREYLEEMLAEAAGVAPGGEEQWIELACGYSFAVATEGTEKLALVTPVLLVPVQPVGPQNVASFAQEVALSLIHWHQEAPADANKGFLSFELTVLRGGAEGEPLKPILRLTNLQIPMHEIEWSKA